MWQIDLCVADKESYVRKTLNKVILQQINSAYVQPMWQIDLCVADKEKLFLSQAECFAASVQKIFRRNK